MEDRPNFLERLAELSAQRWSRELLLAALLTLAAAAFIAAAVLDREAPDAEKLETARKPPA
jgi:hypothetical protein